MGKSNQYSLRTLMIAIAVIAILFGIYATLPDDASIGILLIGGGLSFPATLVAAITGREKVRAFAIGAMPPTILYLLWLLREDPSSLLLLDSDDALIVKMLFAVGVIFVVACGLVGQAIWRRNEKRIIRLREFDDEGNADHR